MDYKEDLKAYDRMKYYETNDNAARSWQTYGRRPDHP